MKQTQCVGITEHCRWVWLLFQYWSLCSFCHELISFARHEFDPGLGKEYLWPLCDFTTGSLPPQKWSKTVELHHLVQQWSNVLLLVFWYLYPYAPMLHCSEASSLWKGIICHEKWGIKSTYIVQISNSSLSKDLSQKAWCHKPWERMMTDFSRSSFGYRFMYSISYTNCMLSASSIYQPLWCNLCSKPSFRCALFNSVILVVMLVCLMPADME